MTDFLRGDEISSCVHRVAISRGEPSGFERPSRAPELERRRRDADQLRRSVYTLIRERHPETVVADSAAITATAIADGATLILNPHLPGDPVALRRAAVHALVRVGRRQTTYTYAPVLIKNNEVVEPAATRRTLTTTLDRINPAYASFRDGVGVRTTPTILRIGLALSHATRVLQNLGCGDGDTRGAVVDRRATVWWLALGGSDYPRFNLVAYDRLYAERLEIVRAHERWRAGDGPFPTEPYWHRECLDCPYAGLCSRVLEERDDVSLTRFTSFDQQEALREHGVTTRARLARLDPSHARPSPTALSTDRPEAHLARVIGRLDELIYRSRAHERGPLRIVAASDVGCPVGDVEVDVDMESYGETTYLWGALVTVNAPVGGVKPGYVAFVNWRDHDEDGEARLFASFWAWFDDLRHRCRDQRRSLVAYCFWAQAEDGAMDRAVRRPVVNGPTKDDLEAFRRSSPPQWVDLHHTVKTQIQTEGPTGLKLLATQAGFQWRDANPSGEASMLWYEVAASDGPAAEASKRRILEYNEDDCRATRALRHWLNGPARLLAHRDDFD